MTSKEDVLRMAREAGFSLYRDISAVDGSIANLERFAALARADERWEQSKRRGVLAFCPYTGRPRHPSDITSDPHGILILVPDQPIRAGGNT